MPARPEPVEGSSCLPALPTGRQALAGLSAFGGSLSKGRFRPKGPSPVASPPPSGIRRTPRCRGEACLAPVSLSPDVGRGLQTPTAPARRRGRPPCPPGLSCPPCPLLPVILSRAGGRTKWGGGRRRQSASGGDLAPLLPHSRCDSPVPPSLTRCRSGSSDSDGPRPP